MAANAAAALPTKQALLILIPGDAIIILSTKDQCHFQCGEY
jgi:hypothetical protein